jgi:hypothetical protein
MNQLKFSLCLALSLLIVTSCKRDRAEVDAAATMRAPMADVACFPEVDKQSECHVRYKQLLVCDPAHCVLFQHASIYLVCDGLGCSFPMIYHQPQEQSAANR